MEETRRKTYTGVDLCKIFSTVYYPDFYLPERKLIVEIKSTMWYNKHLNINLAKQKQCILNGYNFIFIIDKNYEEFEKLLNLTFFH